MYPYESICTDGDYHEMQTVLDHLISGRLTTSPDLDEDDEDVDDDE